MTIGLDPERDLASLRAIVTTWRRAEWQGRGGNRIARQLAIYDLAELWRVELVGWSRDLDALRGFHPHRAAAP